jgi:hypothetical protein
MESHNAGKSQLTSACTRLPTARFFKGSAPAKMPLVEGSLAGPAAGNARALGRFSVSAIEVEHKTE